MSDLAVLVLLVILGPVIVVGILANLVLWFGWQRLAPGGIIPMMARKSIAPFQASKYTQGMAK